MTSTPGYPGLLGPKLEDQDAAKTCTTAAIKDDILIPFCGLPLEL